MTTAGFDDEGCSLTDGERRRLADIESLLDDECPDLARMARAGRDPVDARRGRGRSWWLADTAARTRWAVIAACLFTLLISTEMFFVALRAGSLSGLVLTTFMVAAVGWFLTRPSAAPPP